MLVPLVTCVHQVLSAREQDRLYQMCIRQTVAGLGPSQRAMISPSLETSSEGDEEEDETEVAASFFFFFFLLALGWY